MFSVVYTTHGPPMLNYVRNVPKHQVFACPWAVQKLFMPYSEKFFLYGARDYSIAKNSTLKSVDAKFAKN